jgi:hypothetical protein
MGIPAFEELLLFFTALFKVVSPDAGADVLSALLFCAVLNVSANDNAVGLPEVFMREFVNSLKNFELLLLMLKVMLVLPVRLDFSFLQRFAASYRPYP